MLWHQMRSLSIWLHISILISILLRSWWIFWLYSLLMRLILICCSCSLSLNIIISWVLLSYFTSTYNLISLHIYTRTILLIIDLISRWFDTSFSFFWLYRVSINLSLMEIHLTTTLNNILLLHSLFWTFIWFNTTWTMTIGNKVICLCLCIIQILMSLYKHLLWIIYKLRKWYFLFLSWMVAISIWIIINMNLNCRYSIYSIHSLHVLTEWSLFFMSITLNLLWVLHKDIVFYLVNVLAAWRLVTRYLV